MYLSGAHGEVMTPVHECSCAQTYYRNNHDGTQDFIKKGQSRCLKCHGSGYVSMCVECGGAGVAKNARCAACGGCGFRSQPAPQRNPG